MFLNEEKTPTLNLRWRCRSQTASITVGIKSPLRGQSQFSALHRSHFTQDVRAAHVGTHKTYRAYRAANCRMCNSCKFAVARTGAKTGKLSPK
jgi:hypothetical protein